MSDETRALLLEISAMLRAIACMLALRALWLLAVAKSQTFQRWWCRHFGHTPIYDERGSPVTSFNVCTRCGKFWRDP